MPLGNAVLVDFPHWWVRYLVYHRTCHIPVLSEPVAMILIGQDTLTFMLNLKNGRVVLFRYSMSSAMSNWQINSISLSKLTSSN